MRRSGYADCYDIPDEVLISLKENPEEFYRHFRMAKAVKLYQLGKLSSGRASQLAGIPRVVFLQSLAEYGVPIFDLSKEEIRQDLENA